MPYQCCTIMRSQLPCQEHFDKSGLSVNNSSLKIDKEKLFVLSLKRIGVYQWMEESFQNHKIFIDNKHHIISYTRYMRWASLDAIETIVFPENSIADRVFAFMLTFDSQ